MTKVYLAGPMVFYPDPDAVFAEMKAIMAAFDLVGVAPLDNQVGLEDAQSGPELARSIYRADAELMLGVDAAIFNIDPFRRGTEMDAGTAFEVGFCAARRLPMTGWTVDGRPYPDKVKHFFSETFGLSVSAAAATGSGATSGAARDPDGMLVHSEGMRQNLMIEMAIESLGGAVVADPDWRKAFRGAARRLRRLLDEAVRQETEPPDDNSRN